MRGVEVWCVPPTQHVAVQLPHFELWCTGSKSGSNMLEHIFYNEARERSEPFFLGFPREKKPLHNGSYEHRVPKIKTKHYSVPGMFGWMFVCDSTS